MFSPPVIAQEMLKDHYQKIPFSVIKQLKLSTRLKFLSLFDFDNDFLVQTLAFNVIKCKTVLQVALLEIMSHKSEFGANISNAFLKFSV